MTELLSRFYERLKQVFCLKKDCIANLTSESNTDPLAASQGLVIQGEIDEIKTDIESLNAKMNRLKTKHITGTTTSLGNLLTDLSPAECVVLSVYSNNLYDNSDIICTPFVNSSDDVWYINMKNAKGSNVTSNAVTAEIIYIELS